MGSPRFPELLLQLLHSFEIGSNLPLQFLINLIVRGGLVSWICLSSHPIVQFADVRENRRTSRRPNPMNGKP